MRRMFDVWVERSRQGPGIPTELWAIWVQSRSPSRPHELYRLDGVAVRPLMSGVGLDSAEYRLWLAYGRRTARGWNLLRLAAELFDLRPDTPPYVLADRAFDAGEHHLAIELVELFCTMQSPQLTGVAGPITWPGPAEHETGEKGYIVV